MLEADGGQTSAPIHRQVRTRSGRPHSVEEIADFELEAIAFQCLKIGLARDRVDQLDDVADTAGRLRELADLLGGRACLADSVVCYARRVLHLAADLVDGRRQFFRCGCDGLHVGGRDDRRQFLRTLSGSRQRTRGGFELGGGRRDRFDDLSDGGLELVGKAVHVLAPLVCREPVLLGFGQRLPLRLLSQHRLDALDRARGVADLVAAGRPSGR